MVIMIDKKRDEECWEIGLYFLQIQAEEFFHKQQWINKSRARLWLCKASVKSSCERAKTLPTIFLF